jgi:hypothetical protein
MPTFRKRPAAIKAMYTVLTESYILPAKRTQLVKYQAVKSL